MAEVHKVGRNSFGPAGLAGLAGVVLSSVLYGLTAYAPLLPAPWGDFISATVGVLTALGIYRLPNHILPARCDPAPDDSTV
jgi:hypothetical protein